MSDRVPSLDERLLADGVPRAVTDVVHTYGRKAPQRAAAVARAATSAGIAGADVQAWLAKLILFHLEPHAPFAPKPLPPTSIRRQRGVVALAERRAEDAAYQIVQSTP